MNILFTKMHGLGNDFVVIDATKRSFDLTAQQIQAMANRHTGIGFDQMLIIEPAKDESVDFNYRIFNADGGEVEQCGNGARCVAQYIYDEKLSDKSRLCLSVKKGQIAAEINKDKLISVNMGRPYFTPQQIPFIAEREQATYRVPLADKTIEISVVGIGNPHAVVQVASVSDIDIANLGKQLATHRCFPEGVNVEFMQIINRKTIALRVYERGVGETDACGSGACAAMVAGNFLGVLDDTVVVKQRGGDLIVHWKGTDEDVVMTGPAQKVFKGEWLVT